MLYNYFKISVRTLLKFRGYAIINLLGLSLGLMAGILIVMYVQDELSFDRFHENGDRVYRVVTQFHNDKSGTDGMMETNGWPVGSVLRREFPEVEAVIYTRSASSLLVSHEGKRIREKIHFVSPEFFSLFTFPLLRGNAATALNEPYQIVITETMEKKYFPGGDALNKTLTLSDTLQFLVTGVAADVPSNSHIQFDMLISFATFESLNPTFKEADGWGNINMHNYLLLREGTDAQAFAEKARNIYMDGAGEMMKSWGVSAYVAFEPLHDIYLKTKTANDLGPKGSIDRVWLLAGVAAFVILLACINFINLTTARSVYRAREVGLRKVVGSTRRALMIQFICESMVLTVIAFFIAVVGSVCILPIFNTLLAKQYSLSSLLTLRMLPFGIGLVLLITILSGYYPSLVLSALKPVHVLKGKIQNSTAGVRLRRVLVVFQFVISAGLVIGTLVVIEQLDFMQKQELGFAKDEIIVVNAARVHVPNPNAFETFKHEIKRLAIVGDVSFTNALPGNRGWVGQIAYPEGREGDDAVSVEYMAVDEDYIKTLGLTVVSGMPFDHSREADLKDGLILNETAMSDFGWTTPAEAIGKKITSPSGFPAGEVIAVVKDYHQSGLQQQIGPMVMDYNPASSYLYAIRYKAADTRQLIDNLQSMWRAQFPGYDFNYFFLDQDFERQYQSEARLASVFAMFAAITVIIAVIGLLGLVSFMVVSRTKEIGVRKVLGANVFSITKLLSVEFLVLVVIANVIAFPLAWYGAGQWLEGFAYRTPLHPMVFILTLLIGVVLTLITISFQTVRAAMADPVKSLRYE